MNVSWRCCFRLRSPLSSLLRLFLDADFLSKMSRYSDPTQQEPRRLCQPNSRATTTATTSHKTRKDTYPVDLSLFCHLRQLQNRAYDVVVLDVLLEARAQHALDHLQLLHRAPRPHLQLLAFNKERNLRRLPTLSIPGSSCTRS